MKPGVIINTESIARPTGGAILLMIVFLIFNSCQQKADQHTKHDQMESEMEGMSMEENKIAIDTSALRSLVLPVNFQVVSSQKSVKPVSSISPDRIEARGYISMDERRNKKVSARISGRIEKLYIKYNLQFVNKGDKIMEVYSPELNTYQSELLYLIKSKADQSVVDQAEEKLRLLGIAQDQINDLKKSEESFYTVTVRCPQNGFVFLIAPNTQKRNMNEAQSTSEPAMNGMQAANSNPQTSYVSTNTQLREGSYINKGDILFWINDLRQMWALIAVANSHEHEVTPETKVSIVSELFMYDTINTKINFIEPVYQPEQKFIRVRVDLPNPGYKYKINSLLNAEIHSKSASTLSVPYSSVLFLGKRKIVWVLKGLTPDKNKVYEARDVITGTTHDNEIEIKSGLMSSEEVALDAGYLLDRESLIKPGEK